METLANTQVNWFKLATVQLANDNRTSGSYEYNRLNAALSSARYWLPDIIYSIPKASEAPVPVNKIGSGQEKPKILPTPSEELNMRQENMLRARLLFPAHDQKSQYLKQLTDRYLNVGMGLCDKPLTLEEETELFEYPGVKTKLLSCAQMAPIGPRL